MKNFEFTVLTDSNIYNFRKLFSSYAQYRIDSLKHNGESPYSRHFFKNELSEKLKEAVHSPGEKEHHIVMHSGKKLIGYVSYVLSEKDTIVRLPFAHSTVCNFYIVPHLRGKGYGRILYVYVEKIVTDYGSPLILLKADPVTGFVFWKKMGYKDTGLNKGRGLPLVFFKCLDEFENAESFELEIEAQRCNTAMYCVNPFNKNLIKTLEPIWISYWQNTLKNSGKATESKRKIKKRLKNRLEFARKTPKYCFAAFYHNGTVKGFAQYGVAEGFQKLDIPGNFGYIYEFGISEEFRRNGFGTAMNKHIEEFFIKLGATVSILTPDPVTGLEFWRALGYEDTGIECEKGKNYFAKHLS